MFLIDKRVICCEYYDPYSLVVLKVIIMLCLTMPSHVLNIMIHILTLLALLAPLINISQNFTSYFSYIITTWIDCSLSTPTIMKLAIAWLLITRRGLKWISNLLNLMGMYATLSDTSRFSNTFLREYCEVRTTIVWHLT